MRRHLVQIHQTHAPRDQRLLAPHERRLRRRRRLRLRVVTDHSLHFFT